MPKISRLQRFLLAGRARNQTVTPEAVQAMCRTIRGFHANVPPEGCRGVQGTMCPKDLHEVLTTIQALHAHDVRLWDFGAGGGNVVIVALLLFHFDARGCELDASKCITADATARMAAAYLLRHTPHNGRELFDTSLFYRVPAGEATYQKLLEVLTRTRVNVYFVFFAGWSVADKLVLFRLFLNNPEAETLVVGDFTKNHVPHEVAVACRLVKRITVNTGKGSFTLGIYNKHTGSAAVDALVPGQLNNMASEDPWLSQGFHDGGSNITASEAALASGPPGLLDQGVAGNSDDVMETNQDASQSQAVVADHTAAGTMAEPGQQGGHSQPQGAKVTGQQQAAASGVQGGDGSTAGLGLQCSECQAVSLGPVTVTATHSKPSSELQAKPFLSKPLPHEPVSTALGCGMQPEQLLTQQDSLQCLRASAKACQQLLEGSQEGISLGQAMGMLQMLKDIGGLRVEARCKQWQAQLRAPAGVL